MECTVCSRSLADDVVVEAVRAATVPPPGDKAFSTDDHVAIIQPVVLAFAQYLHGRDDAGPTEPGRQDAARRFWAVLSPFEDTVDTVRLVATLEALTEQHRTTCIRSQTERRSSVIPPWCDRDRACAKRPIRPGARPAAVTQRRW